MSVWPVSSSGQLFRHLGSCGEQSGQMQMHRRAVLTKYSPAPKQQILTRFSSLSPVVSILKSQKNLAEFNNFHKMFTDIDKQHTCTFGLDARLPPDSSHLKFTNQPILRDLSQKSDQEAQILIPSLFCSCT